MANKETHESAEKLVQLLDMPIEDDDVQQGAIFWLPSKESLPRYAVRRAHGKGAIEDGIFQHPVVIISRPKEERQIVHFNLVCASY